MHTVVPRAFQSATAAESSLPFYLPLSAFISNASLLSLGWSSSWMVAVLSFMLCPTPSGVPPHPHRASYRIHIGILSSFISSPPWLDRAADPTQPALFCPCVSHCLILESAGFRHWCLGTWAFSVPLPLFPPPLPSFPSS